MSRPQLFDTGPGLAPAADPDAAVVWPGGTVVWACGDPASSRADAAWQDGERRLFAWELPTAHVELALAPVTPELPQGMEVDATWLGHWRVRMTVDGPPPVLSCGLRDGAAAPDLSPACGEWLDAQEWDPAGVTIAIGTEDVEALAMRAGTLPRSWREALPALASGSAPGDVAAPTRFGPDRLDLVLPSAPAGATLDLHHAAAWRAVERDELAELLGERRDEMGPWFAVDLARAELPPHARHP